MNKHYPLYTALVLATFTLSTASSAFEITTSPKTTLNTRPVIEWSAHPKAKRYHLLISKTGDCLQPLDQQDYQNITGNAFTPRAPLPYGKHHICLNAEVSTGKKIPAQNNGSMLDVSRVGPFTIEPLGVSEIAVVTLKWKYSTGATSYSIALSKDAACKDKLPAPNSVPVTSFTTPKLDDGTYYFCVTAQHYAGFQRPADNSPMAFSVKASGRTTASEHLRSQ